MSKKLLFDESNNVLKEWFYNRPINPELNEPVMKMTRELAGEMCHRFNLQVIGVNHAKYNYGDIKLDDPITDTTKALAWFNKEKQKGRGLIAFILSRDGVARGWVCARYSDRYECYQYVYTNIKFGDGKNNFVQSKKLSTVVNRASKQFELINSFDNPVDEHLTSRDVQTMLRSISNPEKYLTKKRDIASDISSTEAEALVYHLIDKSPIDKSLSERINKVYCNYKEINAKIDEVKSAYSKLYGKPIYILSYSNSVPNIYHVRKMKVNEDKLYDYTVEDFEVIKNDINNSKYGELLKPRLAMWNSCKTELFSKDSPREVFGSKYHVFYNRGYSSSYGQYDDGLGLVCYSDSDVYTDLRTQAHIMILDAD